MDRLRRIEIFVAVADRRNFSAAARALGVSPATVSAAVGALETDWRARLFDRTTRSVRLTAAGSALAEHGRRILRQLEAADVLAAGVSGQVRGTIRISAPVSYGTRVLAGPLAGFLRDHPEVDLTVDLTDRRADLIAEGYDLAIRVGDRIAPGLTAKLLVRQRLVLCAAPSYLDDHGVPEAPEDLASHACLVFTPRLPMARWTFAKGAGMLRDVMVNGPLRSDNGEVLQVAAREGAGITLAPDFLVADDLASGQLVELLVEWRTASLGVYSVRIGGRAPLRVARLTDYLRDALRSGGHGGAKNGSPS